MLEDTGPGDHYEPSGHLKPKIEIHFHVASYRIHYETNELPTPTRCEGFE
jgi:hypothetical protein